MQEAINNNLAKHGFEHFKPKAVLFDMDGVLYDSMPNHAKAWQQAMAQFGIRMTEADAYATEGARGIDTIRQMVRHQQGRDISIDEAQLMYDVKTRLFHEMPHARIFYGVRPLMRKLTEMGITIGVVTGSGQRPLIDRLVHDFGHYLNRKHIVTAYDVVRGKPAPDPYLMGLRMCGNVKAEEAVVIENAPLGVRAGVAAGCRTIAINTGPLPDEVLLAEGAYRIFPRISLLSRQWTTLFDVPAASEPKSVLSWEETYHSIISYMQQHHRRPSKYKPEDLPMVNWIKYNKKRYARGKMSADRLKKFEQLLEMGKKYRRINQYSYIAQSRSAQEDTHQELPLFDSVAETP